MFYHLPSIEKYKPQHIDEIVIPDIIRTKAINIINENNLPNLIISGSNGIGKSCIIRIIANELYKEYMKDAVLELNLFDDTDIQFLQKDIINFCKTKIPYKNNDAEKYPLYKLIIFNESDKIINRIQDQIGMIMDKYPNNIRFVLTCNSTSGINEGIQTKCLNWIYPILTINQMVPKLIEICNIEKIKYDMDAFRKNMLFVTRGLTCRY